MTWAYGEAERDEAESIAVIHRALELGVTLLDTADMYGPYTNEELVGRALDGRRDEAVLATKCGLVVEDAAEYVLRQGRPAGARARGDRGLAASGCGPTTSTCTSCTASTRRRRSRRPGARWPSWSRRARPARSGSPRSSVDELERAHAIHPVASVQSEALAVDPRRLRRASCPWCAEHGAAFLPFAPLGRGFLTGKLAPQTFPPGDFRKNNPRFQPDAMDANLALVERVRAVADRHRRHARAGRARLAAGPGRARRPDPRHEAPQPPGGERRGGGAGAHGRGPRRARRAPGARRLRVTRPASARPPRAPSCGSRCGARSRARGAGPGSPARRAAR